MSYSSYSKSSKSNDKEYTSGHFKFVPNQILLNRYELIKELGTGTFAKVFEAIDHHANNAHVAIKIIRAVSRYVESAEIEAKYLKQVNERDQHHVSHVLRYYDSFRYEDHYCIVQELLGSSLYEYLKANDYQPYPLAHVQSMLKQLLECLQYFDSISLSHTDLKLENILLVNDDSYTIMNKEQKPYRYVKDPTVRIIDFGGAVFEHEHKSRVINTRQYRGPEVILEVGWNTKSDIWSAGCIAFELYTGELLFQTHNNVHHLALIEKFCGPIPVKMIEKADHHIRSYFDKSHRVRLFDLGKRSDIDHYNHSQSLDRTVKDADLLDLLQHMLKIDPEERYDAKTALKHKFFQNTYSLPQ